MSEIKYNDYVFYLLPSDLRSARDVVDWMQKDLQESDKLLEGRCDIPYAYTMRLAAAHERLLSCLETQRRQACERAAIEYERRAKEMCPNGIYVRGPSMLPMELMSRAQAFRNAAKENK